MFIPLPIAEAMIFGYYRFNPDNPEEKHLLDEDMRVNGADEIYSEVFDKQSQLKQVIKRIGVKDILLLADVSHVGSITNFRRIHEQLSQKKANIELTRDDVQVEEIIKLAEINNSVYSSRIKAGYRKKREQGAAWGNIAFGYTVDEDKKFIPHPKEWDIARFIIDKYLEVGNLRKTIKAIHDEHGLEWSVTGLRSWILNPLLQGHTRYNATDEDNADIRYNTHQPLITPEESQQIVNTLEKGRKKWGVNSRKHSMGEPYALKGLLYCGVCGSSMFRHRTNVSAVGGGVEKVRCRKRDEAKHLCSNKKSANLRMIEEDVIDILIEKMKEVQALLKESRRGTIYPEPEEVKIIRKQVTELKKIEKIRTHPSIIKAIDALESEIDEQQKKLGYEFERNKEALHVMSNHQLVNKNYWHYITEKERMDIFEKVIKRVEIKDGKLYDLILKI
ncbi:MAG: recombinase zinc beta ribbon domain-containing protein [Cyanobacteria bacterium J06621_15]